MVSKLEKSQKIFKILGKKSKEVANPILSSEFRWNIPAIAISATVDGERCSYFQVGAFFQGANTIGGQSKKIAIIGIRFAISNAIV